SIACLRFKTEKIRKLNKFIGKYSFFPISPWFNNGRFHVIYTYFFGHTTQFIKYSFHTIEKTFLVFPRQRDGKGTVTKRQRQNQTMNINVFPVFYSLHKTKVKLCFGRWMRKPFIILIVFLSFEVTSILSPFLHELTHSSV